MKFLVSAFIALVAIGLIIALVIGVAVKTVALLIAALLVVGVVSYIVRKLKGPRSTLPLDHPLDAERLGR